MEFIESNVKEVGKPPVRAASGCGDDQPVGSLAPFNSETISTPEPGWKWGGNGQSKVDEFVAQQLLPLKRKACGLRAPYSDPLLRNGKTYSL